jgi:hypothetical protein
MVKCSLPGARRFMLEVNLCCIHACMCMYVGEHRCVKKCLACITDIRTYTYIHTYIHTFTFLRSQAHRHHMDGTQVAYTHVYTYIHTLIFNHMYMFAVPSPRSPHGRHTSRILALQAKDIPANMGTCCGSCTVPANQIVGYLASGTRIVHVGFE